MSELFTPIAAGLLVIVAGALLGFVTYSRKARAAQSWSGTEVGAIITAAATFLTGNPGRSNRGRTYVPLTGKIPSTGSSGPIIDSTSMGNVSTGWATFFTNWNTAHGSAMGVPSVV